ncbi:MAG: hypothetical protein K8M05_10885 [Deltaproteobacteria bacterium]|nr:hypothetical protein [Kofleriaceae bacterium]
MGGLLLGEFDAEDRDRGRRNVLAVAVAKSGVHLGRLAAALGIGEEYLRRLRRMEESDGPAALLLPRAGGKVTISAATRASWREQFEVGLTPKAVWREQPRRARHAYSAVWREHHAWREARMAAPATAAAEDQVAPAPVDDTSQMSLWSASKTSVAAAVTSDERTEGEGGNEIVPMTARSVVSKQQVQHVGTWLMLALAAELGLYEEADRALARRAHDHDALRIALDAIICALAIGQFCVEGARRLATPSGPALLRAERVPSPSGVRRLLGRLIADTDGGTKLEASVGERLIQAARAEDGPAVFYVDNHLRRYTGKEVMRKGWRMQDRRVLPGTSDYYIHDEDGLPVLRVAVPSHDSLPALLPPLSKKLRDALGPDERILLAFDRAGAHAAPLAELRDAGFEVVTYERKPYPELPTTAFTPTVIAGESVGLHESRLRNLGAGRGRVRRIAVLTKDGRQVNFLAVSKEPAARLVEILWHRWRQENGFKHGVERWGINQLDDRGVESVPRGTIIPNPARRRLDRAYRIARVNEGDARRLLARLPADDPRRAAIEDDLADALRLQQEIEWLRPSVPTHAPVENTELADTLVRHTGQRKAVLDVIRIVCANAEADLAALLAPHLTRPREAKKVIANLLAAPGQVIVTEAAIRVRLAPAATRSERGAINALLEALNQRGLTLPGDRRRLPLRFEAHLS